MPHYGWRIARIRARALAVALAVVAVAASAAAAGYWFGARSAPAPAGSASTDPALGKGGKKILYYRNPMGLPDTSPTPKKDSMGMDYIPVYEGEEHDSSGVKISPEKMQKLGVRTAKVERRVLDAVVRAAGRIEVDERRLFTVAPKFEGYIERLYVNATGQFVARGAHLFDAYSPELLAAQREYAIAAHALAQVQDADPQTVAGMKRLADSALARLRNWDVPEEEIARLAAGGEPRRSLAFRAPAAGFVLEKKAVEGMRFMPGEMLYQLADLSNVWLIADVFEQDIGRVHSGARATVRLEAYPGQRFEGRVTYVYPTLKPETRSAQVRIELANPGGRLKPAMYAQVDIAVGGRSVLVVPNSAVLDTGTRRIVLVDLGSGRFEPREVELGDRGDEYVAVRSGVKDGESVVVAANFLIDAESNMKAALGSMTAAGSHAAGAAEIVHRARGTLEEVDVSTGTLLISHEPVPSLKWPAMTMAFVPANDTVAKAVPPGTAITFEFVERKPGEWVVTRLEPRK
jgi:RND family efflux transporter MFP subunit